MTVLLAWLGGCVEYDPRCTKELPPAKQAVPCGGLCLNEIAADNHDFVVDTADASEDLASEATEDWIELFNNGADAIWLPEYFLVRDDNGYAESPLPERYLAPGDCILLVASAEDRSRGPRTLTFDLNTDFGSIWLLTTTEECVVDRVYYPMQDRDSTFGRAPDGAPDWQRVEARTPCGDPALREPPTDTGTSSDTGSAR